MGWESLGGSLAELGGGPLSARYSPGDSCLRRRPPTGSSTRELTGRADSLGPTPRLALGRARLGRMNGYQRTDTGPTSQAVNGRVGRRLEIGTGTRLREARRCLVTMTSGGGPMGWESLGGSLASAPGVTSWAANEMQVFAIWDEARSGTGTGMGNAGTTGRRWGATSSAIRPRAAGGRIGSTCSRAAGTDHSTIAGTSPQAGPAGSRSAATLRRTQRRAAGGLDGSMSSRVPTAATCSTGGGRMAPGPGSDPGEKALTRPMPWLPCPGCLRAEPIPAS